MQLYLILAIFAGFVGLVVTGTAVFTIWAVIDLRRKWVTKHPESQVSHAEIAGRYLMRWTAFDYLVLALFASGLMFLLVDLLSVIRERQLYPFYHYGYLLSGFIFTLMGMMFIVVRLAIVLKVFKRSAFSSKDHHGKPDEADKPE